MLVFNIFVGLVILVIVCAIIMLIRNELVYKLRIKFNNAIHGYNFDKINKKQYDDCLDYSHYASYDSMLYSFKKLNPEVWLSKEYYEKLKDYLK